MNRDRLEKWAAKAGGIAGMIFGLLVVGLLYFGLYVGLFLSPWWVQVPLFVACVISYLRIAPKLPKYPRWY